MHLDLLPLEMSCRYAPLQVRQYMALHPGKCECTTCSQRPEGVLLPEPSPAFAVDWPHLALAVAEQLQPGQGPVISAHRLLGDAEVVIASPRAVAFGR